MTTDKPNVIAFEDHLDPMETIQVPKDHMKLIYKATDACYSAFMQYMASVSYEKIEGRYEGDFHDIEHSQKNVLLAKGMELHFAELTANTFLEKGSIDSACFVAYFKDFYVFSENNIQAPFLTLKQFNELNLSAYVDDATSCVNHSTLDPFWIGFHHERITFEKELDASVLLALDFAHILFDNFGERINDITEDALAQLESLNEEETRALFSSLFEQHFEALLVSASNSAINEFCNIIIDAPSKVMMKVMRHMEEVAFTFLQSNVVDFIGTFKGNKDRGIFEDVIESFVNWSVKNQDIDSFTLADIKTLQLEDKLTQYKSEAYDFVKGHSNQLSGMDPEERVVAIHARYMLVHDIYRNFMNSACKTIEGEVKTLLSNAPDIDGDKEAHLLRDNALILIHQHELMAEGIMKASYDIWDELYPKTPLSIQLEGDE